MRVTIVSRLYTILYDVRSASDIDGVSSLVATDDEGIHLDIRTQYSPHLMREMDRTVAEHGVIGGVEQRASVASQVVAQMGNSLIGRALPTDV